MARKSLFYTSLSCIQPFWLVNCPSCKKVRKAALIPDRVFALRMLVTSALSLSSYASSLSPSWIDLLKA
jgi:hypothetical protein